MSADDRDRLTQSSAKSSLWIEDIIDPAVFDVPGSTGCADAHVLSRSNDVVLYAMKVGRTKRSSLKKGVVNLQQAGINVLRIAAVTEKPGR